MAISYSLDLECLWTTTAPTSVSNGGGQPKSWKTPRLRRISFKAMRHFKGTQEYHHTKDILHVMQTLGHKNIKNTLVYTHLAEELFRDEQVYVSRVATNQKDACALVNTGFEFVCDWNGHKNPQEAKVLTDTNGRRR